MVVVRQQSKLLKILLLVEGCCRVVADHVQIHVLYCWLFVYLLKNLAEQLRGHSLSTELVDDAKTHDVYRLELVADVGQDRTGSQYA